MSRLPRLGAVLTAGLLAVSAPALALTATHSTPSATAASVDPALVAQADAADGALVTLIAHGTSFDAVSTALADVGMPALVEFPLIDAVATAGTTDQIAALGSTAGITHLEADVALEYLDDTSNIATRGAELIEGYTVPVDTGAASAEDDGLGLGDGNGQGNASGHFKDNEHSQGDADGHDQSTGTGGIVEVPVQADGAGISVAIIDSGVDGTHPMFAELDDDGEPTGASRVKVNKKFAPLCAVVLNSEAIEGTEPLPCFGPSSDGFTDPEGGADVDVPGNDSDTISAGGHGTHVAGIAAGGPFELEDGRVISGAAPKATIISLSAGAGLSVAAATQAQYWVLEHHADPCGDGSCPPIRVVNNSYGPKGGGEFDPEDATVKIQRRLAEQGVVMAWAAGNDGGIGTDNRSNPPGQDPTPGILMVANYDDQGTGTRDGSLAPSSSRGLATSQKTWPDISAPGTDITSACRTYLAVCNSGEGDAGTISGTSMATPHIVGIVAQLFELVPDATPAQIENVIEDTAHQYSFGAAYYPDFRNADHTSSYDKGHGLVDAVAAANELLGLVEAPAVTDLPSCGADDLLIVDGSGDGFVSGDFLVSVNNPVAPEADPPADPTVDILSVDATEVADGLDVVFRIADVTGEVPEGADGYRMHLQATFGDFVYYISTSLTANIVTGELTEDFGIDVLDGSLYSEIIDLDGQSDVDADTITIHVTNEAIAAYNADAAARGTRPEMPEMATGLEFTELSALSQASKSAVAVSSLSTADEAAGQCNFTYGTGAVTGASPTETAADNDSGVDADGNPIGGSGTGGGGTGTGGGTTGDVAGEATLASGDAVAFDGVAPTTTSEYECTGAHDPNCVTYLVHLDTGTLTVAVETPFPLDDFDLLVFDSAGNEVASFGLPYTPPGGLEGGSVDLEAGDYFVVVQPFTAAGEDTEAPSTFTLSASLA